MTHPIAKAPENHFIWASVCDGWRLADTSELSVIEERVPAGASELRHYHENSRQFFYVLSGVATIEVEGIEHLLAVGMGIEIEPGQRHKLINQSTDDVCILVISSPSTRGDRIDLE